MKIRVLDDEVLRQMQGHGSIYFKHRPDHNVYNLASYKPYYNTSTMPKIFTLATAVTDTSTVQISETQGTTWMAEILKFGEAMRRFDLAVRQETIPEGDVTLTLVRNTSHLAVDVAKSAGEGDERDITELTNLDTNSVTLTATSFRQGEVRISKEIALTSRADLVSQARYTVSEDMAQVLDTAIMGTTTATGILQDTAVVNQVYGGSATTPAGLVAGDVITTDLFADAMKLIEDSNFVPNLCYLGTPQIQALRKDSQFVNASEYGSADIIQKGEIGNYLGVKVIKTTNVPSYTTNDSDINEPAHKYGVAGQSCVMTATDRTGRPSAGVVGWKERPSVTYQYWPSLSSHRIWCDQSFGTALLFKEAVCLIKVAAA